MDKQQASDEKHRRFHDKESDFLAFVNLWNYLGEQQKALSSNAFRRLCRTDYLNYLYNAKIVIMDEPTSSLTEKEVNHLFTIIRKLKERGCGIVYISHKMEEIFQLCDEVTVLRDGQWIATEPLAGLTMDKIIAMMVGRSLNQRFPDKENKPGEVILEVRNLTSLRQPSIRDVSFDLHKGEILGIAGLVGAKRTDIVETLFGIREKSAGTITLHGKQINNHNANEAINHGFALVTEERRSTGIYAYLDIGFNSLISNIRNYKKKGDWAWRKIPPMRPFLVSKSGRLQDANKTKKTSQQAENDESWQSSDIEIMKCLANMTCGYGIPLRCSR